MQDVTTSIGATIPEMLRKRTAATPDRPAFVIPVQAATDRGVVTWAEHTARAERLAAALRARGVGRGARVGILAATSADWELVQMAGLMAGAIVVGLDPNYPSETLQSLSSSVDLSALFAQDLASATRAIGSRQDARTPTVFLMQPEARMVQGSHPTVERLLAEGGSLATEALTGPSPDDDAIMVFSSGTTGHPKPIVYRHAQVVFAIDALTGAFPDLDENSRLLCWLPLANLFQRMINFCAVARGAASYMLGDPRAVMDHLPAAAPDLFIGVPRFYERLRAGMLARLEEAPWPVRALARRALRDGVATKSATHRGSISHALAERLIFPRLRAAFGGNVRYLLSGSAPLAESVAAFFEAIGLPIHEAYGVSEDIVPIAMNRAGQWKRGTVGRMMAGNEVVVTAEGEIKVRGPGVFSGYWGQSEHAPGPDAQGFWATGDLGSFDADGYLKISGRKADIFKLSTGRWVAPLDVESRLTQLPYVDHALALGQGRKAVVALIALQPGAGDRQGRQSGADGTALAAQIRADVARVTADLPSFQRPAALVVVPEPFSIGGGELTTNLKLRRKAIAEKHASQVDAAYEDLERAARPSGAHAGPSTPLVRFA
jgi:long-chain acyl-CoA synthetase